MIDTCQYSSQSRAPFAGERRFSKSRGLSASVSFAPLPHPPPSYFCSRPIFRAGETLKTRFFALFSTETLATQARENRARNGSSVKESVKSKSEKLSGSLNCVSFLTGLGIKAKSTKSKSAILICLTAFCSWMLRNIHERRRQSDGARSLIHSLTHSLTHSILINLFIKTGLNRFSYPSPA